MEVIIINYLIIFLIALKNHPLLSFLGILICGLILPLIIPKKFKLPVFISAFIFFSICFVNIFVGHFFTNYLIYNWGNKGEGIVTNISETSRLYDDEAVLRYDVMIKTSDKAELSTYCSTLDLNIINNGLLNEYSYPKPGIKFNTRFLKDHPNAFVIIADDDSEYSKSLKSNN